MDSFHPEQCDLCHTLRYDTFCHKCSRHLCKACHHGHACTDEAGLIKEKEKQRDSYKQVNRQDAILRKYVCPEHKSEYNRFCGKCGIVLCQECCENDHIDHDKESVPTASKKCSAIVRDILANVNHDINTAVKLVTDLHDIISEIEAKKQIQDVKDLVQKVECLLINAVKEKQKEEKEVVTAYIKELESCIGAWDKNRDKLDPVAKEVNSVPFLLGFCDYVHDHENKDFPEALDTNFLPHDRILHFENEIERDISSLVEFFSSLTGIYTISGITSRIASPTTINTSVNLSTSGTTRIHKLFTKHPQKEQHKINEKYVKKLEKDIENQHLEIQELESRLSEVVETCENLKKYAKNMVESDVSYKEQKMFVKTDGFHKLISEVSDVILHMKQQIIEADVQQKSLMFQYEKLMDEKEDIRQRFIDMAGRTLSSVGSARSRDAESDEPLLPKRIVEMFGELYKREWRETLDDLSIRGKWQAHIVIQHLHMIIQTCFISCKQISAKQTKDMLSSLFVDEEIHIQKVEMKHTTDFKRKTATTCAINLQKMLLQKPEFQACMLKWEKKDYDLLSEIMNSQYFNKCVYLAWMMVVQSPPMYMDEGPLRRSYIKREVYSEFTKKGSIVDYCVWPALYIEKGGPLGSKGLVQVY